jgi:biotin operon repressor
MKIEELKSVGLDITEEHKDGKLLIDIYTVI